AGATVTDDARAYRLVLTEVERVLTRTGDYEPLWRAAWTRIEAALESFARGASGVEESADARFSLITLAPGLFSPKGFDPARHAMPITAISHHARGQLFLIAAPMASGWAYRADYPYYSWAETIVRPAVVRRDFGALMARLNELEKGAAGAWRADTSELASAFKFMDAAGAMVASSLPPERVSEEVHAALVEAETGVERQTSAGAAPNG
ncbi:MAG TPA: DUF6687 family protein, partial [Pyrinomonadaceae bacterium]|nr:DUF6687 family protein [Pyrinomonadaceae bacterium]